MVYTKYQVQTIINKLNRMTGELQTSYNKFFLISASKTLGSLLRNHSLDSSEADNKFAMEDMQIRIAEVLRIIVYGHSSVPPYPPGSILKEISNGNYSLIQEFVQQCLIEQKIQRERKILANYLVFCHTHKISESAKTPNDPLLKSYKQKIWVYCYLLVKFKFHEISNDIDSCLVLAENLELDKIAQIVHNNPLSTLQRSAIKGLIEQNEECDAIEQEFLERYEIKQLKLCIFEAVTTVPQERLDQARSEQALLQRSPSYLHQ
ncbi:hypothetical protein RLOatenuis_2000 [Rickettsiales bacterium]|nr:hypothetical protein RLOatenuis_2000 [Rickettsiales bacterium]